MALILARQEKRKHGGSMKTIPWKDLEGDAGRWNEVCQVLNEGGLVCLPCGGSYRIVADLSSEQAVSHLLQSKRRIGWAPTLVFVKDERMLSKVAATVCPLAKRLINAFWPGPLTILFEANPELPQKVTKALTKANGKLGVRVPDHPVLQQVLRACDRPLFVSSANVASRSGASSPAQVRKNFLGRVDVFIDAGDLEPAPASTVIDVIDDQVQVTRPGVIPDQEIKRVATA
jgi:L-threonylcarbamoyladenylate synthase